MFLDLKKLGLLNTFLEQTKKIDLESYEDWQKHMISRIYRHARKEVAIFVDSKLRDTLADLELLAG